MTFKQSARHVTIYVLVLPGLAIAKLLALLGLEICLYPTLFGHQAIEVEYLLRKRLQNETKGSKKFIYIEHWTVPNRFLMKKHAEKLSVIRLPGLLLRYVSKCAIMNHKYIHWNVLPTQNYEEMKNDPVVWHRYPAQLEFSEEEHREGRKFLEEMGLQAGKYVCFHTRESAYPMAYVSGLLFARGGRRFKGASTETPEDIVAKREQTLFQRYRYSDPSRYAEALDYLAENGVKSVRLGAIVDGALAISRPHIVDYAGSRRSELGDRADFADAYLMAHCKFFLGSATGVSAFASSLNKPIVLVNTFPWPWTNLPYHEYSIYLPKIIFNRLEGRVMSFTELVEFSKKFDWRLMYKDEFIEEQGIEPIENTAEEIHGAVVEMNEKIEGTLKEDPRADALQSKLRSMFTEDTQMHGLPSKMGAEFLKTHTHTM